MNVKDNVTVKEYFEEVVPELFKEQLGGKTTTGMDGTLFSIQFNIDSLTYSLQGSRCQGPGSGGGRHRYAHD